MSVGAGPLKQTQQCYLGGPNSPIVSLKHQARNQLSESRGGHAFSTHPSFHAQSWAELVAFCSHSSRTSSSSYIPGSLSEDPGLSPCRLCNAETPVPRLLLHPLLRELIGFMALNI